MGKKVKLGYFAKRMGFKGSSQSPLCASPLSTDGVAVPCSDGEARPDGGHCSGLLVESLLP